MAPPNPTGKVYNLIAPQFGAQTVWSTAVAATFKPMNVTECTLESDNQTEMIKTIGTFAPATNSDITRLGGKLTIKFRKSYEDASYWYQMQMGIQAPSGAGPYVRDYDSPHTSAYVPVVSTLEYAIVGDSGFKYKAVNCVMTKYKEELKAGDVAVMCEAEFATGTIDVLSALASLADRTTTLVRAMDLVAAIDAAGGTPGTTVYSNTVYSYSLEIETNAHMKQFIGSAAPGGYGLGPNWAGKFELKCEFTSAIKTEVDLVLASTALNRLIRLTGTRATQLDKVTVSGTQNGSFKPWENENGNVATTFDILPKHDTTEAYWLNYNNTSTIATLLM